MPVGTPRRATGRRIAWVAVVVAVLAANVAVFRLSTVALGTPSSSDPWVDGELTVGDHPAGAGLFDVEDMLPGRTEVRCLVVRYAGSGSDDPGGPVSVRLYATDLDGGLAPYLDVVVEAGSGCDAGEDRTILFAGTLDAMPSSWVQASPAWLATTGEQRAYRFSVTLRDDPAALLLEARAGFVWEARPHAVRPSAHGVLAGSAHEAPPG